MRELSIEIVRKTFEYYILKQGLYRIPYELPPELSRAKNGIFIAVFERIGLTPRGRVGSIFPSKSTICEEIQAHTISLAKTYAFRKNDLPFLTYELLMIKTPHLLSHISELKQENGLLIRTETSKIAYSLPASIYKKPEQRLAETCSANGIDRGITDLRLYHFGTEKINEHF
ncbi:MAG: hypothetical protein Q7S57_00630 [bacterium]|nr:hypothetical protein [bacterium]